MPLRRFTPAELVLTQRLHLERPLLALVLLGALALALAEGSPVYLALTAAAVGLNALALQQRLELYVPRWLVNAAVLGATLYFVAEFVGPAPEVLPVLGHYLALIQVCKLFEQKRNRDYAQIIALSLVQIVASAIMTTGLWFAVVALVYVPVAFYVAMVLTLKVALDRQASSRLSGEPGPADPHRLAWQVSGAFPGQALWRLARRSAVGAMAIAAGVFLLMPRGLPGMLGPVRPGGGGGGGGALTGFARSLTLRDVGRIGQDPRVVMRVQVACPAGGSPPGGGVYLRGRVYDEYHDGEWRSWPPGPPWWGGHVPSPRRVPEGPLLVQDVTMDPALLPSLFAIAPVLYLDTPEGVPLGGTYPDPLVEERAGGGPVRYRALSWVQPLSAEQRDYLRRIRGHVPTGPVQAVSPAIAALARSWCGDLLGQPPVGTATPARAAPDRPSPWRALGRWWRQAWGPVDLTADESRRRDQRDLAVAERIAQRLRAEYSYTLDLPEADLRADPVEEFLFRTRRGHCEYFASAMTLLCRAMGVRARLAAGFLVGDSSAPAAGYLVRARDAHAWCEVYTPSTDWVIFDPTPAGAVAHRSGPLENLWDSITFFWSTRVIGYGEADRQGLFGAFLRAFDFTWRSTGRFFVRLGRNLWDLVARGRMDPDLGRGLAVVAVGAAVPLALLLLRRSLRGHRRPPRADLPLGAPRFYRRLLKLLRRRGLRPRPAQTPREFCAQAERSLRLPALALAEPVRALYLLRWAHADLSPEDLARAELAVDELARRLADR